MNVVTPIRLPVPVAEALPRWSAARDGAAPEARRVPRRVVYAGVVLVSLLAWAALIELALHLGRWLFAA